jgi:methionine biosynthesis protein MetW
MSIASPDKHAAGFLASAPNPLRYDGHTNDPAEAAGIISALVQPNARVLDVGCGTGSVSKIIVEATAAQLTGIEPDSQRAAVAQLRGINVILGFFDEKTVEKLGKFDVVVFADVLEHLPDPSAALRLAHQVLKPNGTVVASIPNIAHWSVRLDLLRGRFDYQPYGIMDATHLRWFTEKSVRGLFEATGYKVEIIRHTAGILLPAYQQYFFWRHFRPRRYRNPAVRFLTRHLPRLFGCQHVIRAVRQEIVE